MGARVRGLAGARVGSAVGARVGSAVGAGVGSAVGARDVVGAGDVGAYVVPGGAQTKASLGFIWNWMSAWGWPRSSGRVHCARSISRGTPEHVHFSWHGASPAPPTVQSWHSRDTEYEAAHLPWSSTMRSHAPTSSEGC